ncbi:MAG: hypothetical protein RBT34_05760 [Anaerolineaceae bacterium]|jgi:hypothetical protein|nr:hypothetical protein [Anaerolineaceae bacterium]
MKWKRTTRHWTELSAYLDGQLAPKKAARLQQRLSRDAALQAEYEDLLRTRAMLRSLPKRRVPRNFTLTPDMVRAPRRQKPGFFVPVLRFSSSAAALMLMLTFAFELIGGAPLMTQTAQDAAPAMEMILENAPAETAADEGPMILVWGKQTVPGLGGEMATEMEGLGGGPQGDIPLADAAPEMETMVMEEAAPAIAEAPMPAAAEEEIARAMPSDEAEGAPLEEAAVAEKAYTAGSEDAVILGIPPEEEQGQIQQTAPPIPAPLPERREGMPSLRWLQVGLGTFALGAMLVSFLIPRKRYS